MNRFSWLALRFWAVIIIMVLAVSALAFHFIKEDIVIDQTRKEDPKNRILVMPMLADETLTHERRTQ